MGLHRIDLASNIDAVKAMNATISSSTTTNGDWIDLQEAHGATVVFLVQARTDGTYTPAIQDSDDDASSHSDAAAVDDQYLTEVEADLAMDAANEVAVIGYTGGKRYIRPQITSASVTSGATVVAVVLKNPDSKPVDHAL